MPTEPLHLPQKVALIHDWLVAHRGGEKVLEAICELYPQADIFTLYHQAGCPGPRIERHRIITSFLNRSALLRRHYRHTLPLMPLAIERFDLTEYDLVISSSHCVAKGIVPSPQALHVCYCHTPMRYAWDRYADYFKGGFEALIAPVLHYLRNWDVTSSHRVDHFFANSNWVKDRIKKYYRRDAQVIHPFICWEDFKDVIPQIAGDYYLIVSGFAPNKRIDLAITACEKLGKSLWIVGEGQEESRLRSLAGPHTRFLGKISFEQLKKTYAGARALLFPGEEDFGIAPLEAMACGRPVIAFGRGGVTETVIEGSTGVFFPHSNVESLSAAILDFEKRETDFAPGACRQRASLFTKDKFQQDFKQAVDSHWATHQNRHR